MRFWKPLPLVISTRGPVQKHGTTTTSRAEVRDNDDVPYQGKGVPTKGEGAPTKGKDTVTKSKDAITKGKGVPTEGKGLHYQR